MSVPALIAVLTYCGTFTYPFVFDDEVVIVQNPRIRAWQFVPSYFTESFGAHLGTGAIGYYRPLLLLWFRLNHALFGLHAPGFHVTSVLLHATVSTLVFAVARRLFADWRPALLLAVAYAVYPVHAECAAWVSCASETLMACFFFGAFLAWLKSRETGRSGWWVLASLCCLAALFTKETSVVLPALLFLYAYVYPAGNEQGLRFQGALRSVLPFFAALVLYLAIRIIGTGRLAPVSSDMSFATMVRTWPALLLFYMRGLLWPRTSAFYDLSPVTSISFENFGWPLLMVVVVMMGVVGWAVRSKKHRREILFGAAWVVLTIAPPLYIRAFLPFDIAHLRYLYLPCFGFLLLVVLALQEVGERFPLARFAFSASAIGCAMLAVACLFQQAYWSSDFALYKRSVEIAPQNPKTRMNLGIALMERKLFEPAIAEFEAVLSAHPEFWQANYNLALAFVRVHQPARAVPYADRAIQIDPTDPGEYYLRGAAKLELGNRPEALDDFERALALDPNNAGYRATADSVRTGVKPQ